MRVPVDLAGSVHGHAAEAERVRTRAHRLHRQHRLEAGEHPGAAGNADGFRAYIEPVSDPAFDGLSWEAVKAAVPADDDAVVDPARVRRITSHLPRMAGGW
ncbi:DUF6924 domain-containing protein [Trebonia kvetii]|uniref:DUF6924 domain-containing protein n=1 Tax=Trebonia kvetii TaxID=2480626 RepID=UPI003F6E06DA